MRVHLLVDQSHSMAYGSRSYSKSHYGATLAAAVAHFLHGQGDAVGLATFGSEIVDYLPARNRPGHLRQSLVLLAACRGPRNRSRRSLERMAGLLRKRNLLVLISDLLAPLDQLATQLGYLRSSGHEVLLFNVLDPAGLRLRLRATGRVPRYGNRPRFARRSRGRPPGIRRAFGRTPEFGPQHLSQLGIDYHRLTTDRPLELALYEYLADRIRRGRLCRYARPVRKRSTA